jgi:hypothetical protein
MKVKSELVKVILYVAFTSCQNYLKVIIIMYSSPFAFTSQGKAQRSKRCASYKYISESSEQQNLTTNNKFKCGGIITTIIIIKGTSLEASLSLC